MTVTLRKWNYAQQLEKEYWFSRISPDGFPKNMIEMKKFEYNNSTYTESMEKIRNDIEKFRKLKVSDRVLQIGCGPLDIIHLWQAKERYGVDPLMDFYQRHYPLSGEYKIKNITGKAEDPILKNIKFDIILALNVLDHTHNVDLIVENLKRLCEKDSLLYTVTNTWNVVGYLLRKAVCPFGVDGAHTYTLRYCDINRLFERHGFKRIYSNRNEKRLQYRIMRKSGVKILKILASLHIPVFPYVVICTV